MIDSVKIVDAISFVAGDEFFKALSHHVSSGIDADCIHVALFSEQDRQSMVTIYCGGYDEIEAPLVYFAEDTYCHRLADESVFCCHEDAKTNYPEDILLNSLEMSSCVAIPLKDKAGKRCGSFSVMSHAPMINHCQALQMLYCFAPRVTEEATRKYEEAKLKHELWLSRAALDSIPTPIFYKDKDGLFSGWNSAFATFCGLAGKPDDYCTELEGHLGIYAEEDRELLNGGGTVVVETSVTRADGKRCHVLLNKAGFANSSNQNIGGLVGTMIDITDLKSAEKMVNYLEHYDRLTGLPNQILFQDRLTTEISSARRHHLHLAVFALDLDHFKKINNVFGHNLGDLLLKEVACRLRNTIREEDTLARLGGDSFTLLLSNIRYEEDAAIISRKIQESLSAPFSLGNEEVFISASIGIALYPLDGDDAHALIKNSDIALHKAKESGRNSHLFFTSEMNERASEQMRLQNNLQRALERDEFVLHYQPQYFAETGKMSGVEALLRWQHPQLGMVYPDEFIHLAEHVGLIVPIGEWVIETACRSARKWNEQSKELVRVSVNLSARQFQQPDLFERISEIITRTEIHPTMLGLEITESVVMQNVDYAVDVLRKLKVLGVHISVDDFGTGYSSLSYLKRFPVDLLKIDRAFITDLPNEQDDIAIVSAVISMAHNLKLKVLAEGVETIEQKDFLHSVHCDEFQGFYFSKPIDAGQLTLN